MLFVLLCSGPFQDVVVLEAIDAACIGSQQHLYFRVVVFGAQLIKPKVALSIIVILVIVLFLL